MPDPVETESERKLIFVCGAARSGTTMLDLMLGHGRDAFSCGEIHALFRPFRSHHFAPTCSCGNPRCDVWQRLRNVPEQSFHSAVFRETGIRYVVDSSKDLRWVLDASEWAIADGVDVRNVLIWKEPMDLAYSHWKRGKGIDYWRKSFLDYHERFLRLGLPFVSISYEALVREPASLLEQLCRRIGMDYFAGKEAFWEEAHHHLFGSAGTQKQVSAGSSALRLHLDFPEDFRHAFDEYSRSLGEDDRLESVTAELRRADVRREPRPAPAAGPVRRRRPAWYYRHLLKALWRRHFPERSAIAD